MDWLHSESSVIHWVVSYSPFLYYCNGIFCGNPVTGSHAVLVTFRLPHWGRIENYVASFLPAPLVPSPKKVNVQECTCSTVTVSWYNSKKHRSLFKCSIYTSLPEIFACLDGSFKV